MNDFVSDVMSHKLITVSPKDSMDKVLEIFKKNRIHHLPVVEDEKLVGLITTSDLLWMDRKFEEYKDILAEEVMATKLAVLDPDSKVGTAAQIFLKNWFHALPVVDKHRKLLGIITSFDVLKMSYKKEYPNEKWNWL